MENKTMKLKNLFFILYSIFTINSLVGTINKNGNLFSAPIFFKNVSD